MELWGWLIAYVLLFALLHLALYYYYARRDGDDRPAPQSLTESPVSNVRYGAPIDRTHGSVESDFDHTEYEFEIDGEIVECARCGAPNESDATFTYCWNCVSTLG
ncbi:DUF7577 domain-containing protein [Halovivax gelatinilyticus]|uniref:DUF7577 domain-containing protein n=1 Tax=Halovivax gelatinilyticus TaxID=2961597 RepID=UPI0020CA3DC1|nr:hypothetical protein [Halovivax gelatinilyticus]